MDTSCPHLVQHGVKVNIKVLMDIHRNVGSGTLELARNYQITPSSFLPTSGVPGELPGLPGCRASSLVLSWSRYLLVHRSRKDPFWVEATRVDSLRISPRKPDIFSSSLMVSEHLTGVEFKNQTILKNTKTDFIESQSTQGTLCCSISIHTVVRGLLYAL